MAAALAIEGESLLAAALAHPPLDLNIDDPGGAVGGVLCRLLNGPALAPFLSRGEKNMRRRPHQPLVRLLGPAHAGSDASGRPGPNHNASESVDPGQDRVLCLIDPTRLAPSLLSPPLQ